MAIEKATTLQGMYKAFRAEPLAAADMAEFYAEDLIRLRDSRQIRQLKRSLLDCATSGLFFQGVLYGNRGSGKTTEINKVLDTPEIRAKFLVIRILAEDELNPQTFSVVDVLSLILVNMLTACEDHCKENGGAFHGAGTMVGDLQQVLAPFFPELQSRAQETGKKEGGLEVSLASLVKASVRLSSERRADLVNHREGLKNLADAIDRYITAAKDPEPLRNPEFLVVGENFDRGTIAPKLLYDTFVQYAPIFRGLRLHLLFTLPVPFVNTYPQSLPLREQFPIHDIPVCGADHQRHTAGCAALIHLIHKRADPSLFDDSALELLIRASGGDLARLFQMIVEAATNARYRCEDDPTGLAQILPEDAARTVRKHLVRFRNEMGQAPDDREDSTWLQKRDKLRAIYEGQPEADVPDNVLYHLLRRRAALFFNGTGRYGVHPLAVELLFEQLVGRDATFHYRGGGLDQLRSDTEK